MYIKRVLSHNMLNIAYEQYYGRPAKGMELKVAGNKVRLFDLRAIRQERN